MKTDFRDVKVGDTLYDSGKRNDTRYSNDPRILHVVKVARQYIYANYNDSPVVSNLSHKISRETGWTDGWLGFQVYRSEEEYKEILYRRDLCAKIRAEFGSRYVVTVPDITTAELREIAKTLKVEF